MTLAGTGGTRELLPRVAAAAAADSTSAAGPSHFCYSLVDHVVTDPAEINHLCAILASLNYSSDGLCKTTCKAAVKPCLPQDIDTRTPQPCAIASCTN